jgi:hypothetical protein
MQAVGKRNGENSKLFRHFPLRRLHLPVKSQINCHSIIFPGHFFFLDVCRQGYIHCRNITIFKRVRESVNNLQCFLLQGRSEKTF